MKVTVELSDYEDERSFEEAVLSAIARRFEESVTKRAGDMFNAKWGAALDAKLSGVVDDELRKAVLKTIDDGFVRTNEYGEPVRNAAKITLCERIAAALNREVGSYDNKKAVVDATVESAVKSALDGAMKEEIEKARKAFRAKIDAGIVEKFGEAMRSAMASVRA